MQEIRLETLSEADYQAALKAERDGKPSTAITSFRCASSKGHLWATLRLAQIFNQGELEVAIDREIAATYFRSAAQLCGVEDVFHSLFRKHPVDAAVFISLMCKAFVIASESGKYLSHAVAAASWYQVLKQIGKTALPEDPDIVERLERQLTEEQREQAEKHATDWIARLT